jgi:hypothetical protein
MSGRHRSAGQRLRTMPMALYVGGLAFTVVFAAGLVLLGVRWFTAPRPAPATLQAQDLPAVPTPAASPGTVGAQDPSKGRTKDQVRSTRLVVPPARHLLDRGVTPGAVVDLPLPRLRPGTSAVLLQLSMTEATGPGQVRVRSAVEDVPALRLPRAGAQTSAAVIVLLGPDHTLRVSSTGGGRLIANLTGTFEAADDATAGRLLPVRAQPVLTLQNGSHDAVVDLSRVSAVRAAGSVSAVLLHVAAQVGNLGGHVAEGRSLRHPNQVVYWAATTAGDQVRHGFLVVHVPADGRIRLHYKAGSYLQVELLGVVTGNRAPQSTTGLVVPVPLFLAPSVRVTKAGHTDVPLIPTAGLVGVPRDRAEAALLTLTATAEVVGDVSVAAPGRTAPAALSAGGGRPRATLTLSGLVNGAVSITNETGAVVVLTPRALILRR